MVILKGKRQHKEQVSKMWKKDGGGEKRSLWADQTRNVFRPSLVHSLVFCFVLC